MLNGCTHMATVGVKLRVNILSIPTVLAAAKFQQNRRATAIQFVRKNTPRFDKNIATHKYDILNGDNVQGALQFEIQERA